MTLSARNQLKGIVEEVQLGGVMAHVVVRVGDNLVESVITRRKLPTRNVYGQFGRRTEASAQARLLRPEFWMRVQSAHAPEACGAWHHRPCPNARGNWSPSWAAPSCERFINRRINDHDLENRRSQRLRAANTFEFGEPLTKPR